MERFYAGGFLYDPKTRRVLLHQRDGNTQVNPHKWAFFGGLNEGNETPVQTFIREVKEELDIDILAEDIRSLCDYFNEEHGTHRYVFFVESELKKSEMRLGEGAGYDWVVLERAFEYDLTEKTRLDLEKFIETV